MIELTKEDVEITYIEALDEYEVSIDEDTGRIKDHGRFENEPAFVVYYWKLVEEGSEDHYEPSGLEDGSGDYYFEIKNAEREYFPDLPAARYLVLFVTGDGFVCNGSAETPPDGDESEGGDL